MTITREQRTYARLAGICILANYVTQLGGDSVTIASRVGEAFEKTARFAADSQVLWRFCLLSVALSWISLSLLAFAFYVVLEPVDRRLAQLALVLRLGASFVGAASMMFRVAQARLYAAVDPQGLFATEQLRTLASVLNRGSGGGVTTAWILQGAGHALFFLLFLRSRYLPGALAWIGIVGSAVLVAASGVMFVYPQTTNWLKLVGVPGLLAEVVTAFLLLFKGLPQEERS